MEFNPAAMPNNEEHSLVLSTVEENPNQSNHFEEGREALAQKETKAVAFLRLLVLALLVTVALVVSLLCYNYTAGTEQDDFEDAVQEYADKIAKAFVANARQRIQIIEGFSQDITSHAIFANETFPNVTLPDFERRGKHIASMADVTAMQVAMLIDEENRASWENYSVENQGWLVEGLAQQEALSEERLEQQQANLEKLGVTGDLRIPPAIYKVEGLGPAPENGPGPYLPYWQMAPAIPVPALVNFNVFSHPGMRDLPKAVILAQRSMVGSSLDYSDADDPTVAGLKFVFDLFVDRTSQGTEHYRGDVTARLVTPIFDTFNETSRKVVGTLGSGLYWRTYFTNLLPNSARGIHVVLDNSCNQSFTYVLHGPECDYLGQGDLHDPAYDAYEYSTGLDAFLGGSLDNVNVAGGCRYGIRVFPSQETEEQFTTSLPLTFTLALVAVFVFTSLVFITYDFIVERRQRLVLQAAIRSGTIVSSLFPKEVRDQMYEESVQKEQAEKDAGAFKYPSTTEGPSSLAHLYPDCTVFFADLVGFTSWSSSRSPEQVFQLLETLYAGLDKIAKKQHVYKIETIGDCYVAVTGLPKAQPDHAVRMTRFAFKCLLEMNEQALGLCEALGPDTANLAMRVGLNSGPVTAGVLRGERARFQLFGDTVNTAARMESNGERGRIHVSPSTAELLRQAGKESWLTKREDLVEAKGKGSIQTWWVLPDNYRKTESVLSTVE